MAKTFPSEQATVVLYDGDCGFCQACVVWAVKRSRVPIDAIRLDSPAGRESLRKFEIPFDIQSVVVVASGSALTKSDAIFALLSHCEFPWHLARVGRLVPRKLRDGLYDLVARHRHRLSGKGCRID